MRKIFKLAKREYLESVKTKGFIIMLVLMPLVMGGSGIAMLLFQGQVDTRDKRIAVIDHSGAMKDMLLAAAEERNKAAVIDSKTGKKIQPAYLFEMIAPDAARPQAQKLDLSDRIRRGELHAFLEIGPNVAHPRGDQSTFRINYHARNAAVDNIRNWLNNVLNNHLRRVRLTEAVSMSPGPMRS